MLLAAVHSTESLDALGDFQVAFLDHKVHIMGMVNSWLADPEMKYSPQCIRVITTLCLIEVGCIDFLDLGSICGARILLTFGDRRPPLEILQLPQLIAKV